MSVTDVGATDITIEWTEVDCADHNGLVTGYNVRYGLQSNSSREIAFVPANVSRSYTIHEVMDHSVYEIEVALVNLNGAGVYSTPITYMNFVPVGMFTEKCILRMCMCIHVCLYCDIRSQYIVRALSLPRI